MTESKATRDAEDEEFFSPNQRKQKGGTMVQPIKATEDMEVHIP